MWLVGVKHKPGFQSVCFFSEISGTESTQNSALFLPGFLLMQLLLNSLALICFFYRGFSQHAVPLDLGVITNHILHIGHLACIPISSCL